MHSYDIHVNKEMSASAVILSVNYNSQEMYMFKKHYHMT